MPEGWTSPLAGMVEVIVVAVSKWERNGGREAPADALEATAAKPVAARRVPARRPGRHPNLDLRRRPADSTVVSGENERRPAMLTPFNA
jgi:hypothetical protein